MRTLASRILLLALAAVALFAAIRGCSGSEEAAVVIEGIDPTSLRSVSFELARPARLAVASAGSFEDSGAGGDTTLAAYGWIVRRHDGGVVWRLSAQNAIRQRGTLAEAADTLQFQPGIYDVYFTSYGDPEIRTTAPRPRSLGERFRRVLSRDGRAWVGDAGRWMIAVTPAGESDRDVISLRADPPDEMLPGGALLWNGAAAHAGERRSWMFEVAPAGARVSVRAVADAPSGEFAARASLERIGGGADTLWTLRNASSRWAGGARRNRAADTTIALQRGLYRISYADTGRHAYGEWVGNPPFLPAAWGLTLSAADEQASSAVSALNPWSSLPRLASFSCVGPSADRRATFVISDSLDVQVHALGEVTGSTVHDGARILRWNGGDPEPIWEMIADETRHGGGADKNRIGEATLSLTPGRYTLAYYTDSSHDCTDFNAAAPDNPSRWGATLFVLDPEFDLRRVTIDHDGARGAAGEVAAIAAATDTTSGGSAAPAGRTLVRLDRLGNNRSVTARLDMPAPGVVRVFAIGEIIPSQRFDYGWITAADGSVLWEMTRSNTHPAGGSQKNRAFDGPVRLPAGSHTVHFRTDGQHAYGSFQQPPPDNPEGWGIRIERTE